MSEFIRLLKACGFVLVLVLSLNGCNGNALSEEDTVRDEEGLVSTEDQQTGPLLPVREFTYEQIKSMSPREIERIGRNLYYSIVFIPYFTNFQTWDLSEFSFEQLNSLLDALYSYGELLNKSKQGIHSITAEQIRSLDPFVFEEIDYYIQYFSCEQLKNLTSEQVLRGGESTNKRYGCHIKKMSVEEIKALSADEIKKMPKHHFTREHIEAFSSEQTKAFVSEGYSPGKNRISALSPVAIKFLGEGFDFFEKIDEGGFYINLTEEEEKILRLNEWFFDYMSKKYLTKEQIQAMSIGQMSVTALRSFTPEQISWMTPEQVGAASTGGSMRFLNTEQFDVLTPEQIAAIPYHELKNITEEQVKSVISVESMIKLEKFNYLIHNITHRVWPLTPEHIANLTGEQIEAFEYYIQFFSPEQMSAFDLHQTSYMPSSLLKLLKPDQIRAMCCYSNYMTKDFLYDTMGNRNHKFSTEQLEAIPPHQIKNLPRELWKDISKYLTKEQIQALSPRQLLFFTKEYFLQIEIIYLTEEQQSFLTAKQLEEVIDFIAGNKRFDFAYPSLHKSKMDMIQDVLKFYQNFLECKKQDPYSIFSYDYDILNKLICKKF